MKKKKIKKEKSLRKEKKLKKESSVYVQIDCEEAISSQKDILSYQMELIKMLRSLKKYKLLRESEGYLKTNLQNILKATNDGIKKLQEKFPQVEGPKSKKKNIPEKEPTIEYYNQDLESQLEQIRKKLAEIGK